MDNTTSGNRPMPQGTAEVHAHVAGGPATGTATAGSTGGGQNESRVDQAKDRAQGMAGQVQERASDLLGQAQNRASGLLDQAQSTLEERGVMSWVRERPLAAFGVAVGLGFVLAGSDNESDDPNSTFGKAKHQLKGAIMGGLSAAVAQEARSMIGMSGKGGAGGILGSLFGQQGGSGTSQGSGTSSPAL